MGNMAITYCVPEGVAPWKGEEGTTVPITVNLEDNDTSDPMTLTLTLYATNADNRGPWTGIRTMTAYNVTGSSYTFYWDGKNDSGAYVEPWTYTFEVDITQTDINYNENPALQVEDATEYRSRYLHILRSRDAFNNPIYEAEYAGYDEGDPNDPNDDSYLYYIRFYDLKDTLDVDASEGELWLYDPNVEKIYSWDVADLECLVEGHAECDGLHATSTGIMHELLVPVPINVMPADGTYRFVLHLKDDHPYKYRDHRKRWARDLNSSQTDWPIIYFSIGSFKVAWCQAKEMNRIEKRIMTLGKIADPTAEWISQMPNGKVRAASNGGLFSPQSTEAIGDWADGTWHSGQACPYKRLAFSMDVTGSDFKDGWMVKNGTMRFKGKVVDRYVAPPVVKIKNHGLANVGLLVSNGTVKSAPPAWPDASISRARTAIAWSANDHGKKHFFIVAIGTSGSPHDTGTDWIGMRDFFKNKGALCDEMKERLATRTNPNPSFTIEKAFMFDGGGSTEHRYRCKSKIGRLLSDPDPLDMSGRLIPNIIGAEGQIRDK